MGKPVVTKLIAAELDVITDRGEFALSYSGRVLRTRGSSDIRHASRDLIQRMIDEFDVQGSLTLKDDVIVEPRFFGSYALFDIQKEHIEKGSDELSTQLETELRQDPMFYRCAGPEVVDQLARWSPVISYLSENGLQLPVLINSYSDDPALWEGIMLPDEARKLHTLTPEFVSFVDREYRSLAPEQRTVTMFLHAIHGGIVMFPLLLAKDRCTPDQYASGVIAAHAAIGGVFDVTANQHREQFVGLRDDARTALEYLRLSRTGPVAELLQGETLKQEFKSTLRWNIKAARNDDAMTHSVLKTIAAFLNSDGGVLYIGVADSGEPLGLDFDGFPNTDKYGLHLVNLLRDSLGKPLAALVDISFPSVSGIVVCRISCPKSSTPAYLKYRPEEEFYVRTGPSSTKLGPSDLVRYISAHFDGQQERT